MFRGSVGISLDMNKDGPRSCMTLKNGIAYVHIHKASAFKNCCLQDSSHPKN